MPMRGEGRLGRHPWHHTVPPPGHERLVIINTISVSQVVVVAAAPLVTTSNYLLSGNVSLQANVPLFSPAGSCFLSWMREKGFFFHLFIIWVCHSSKRSFFFFLSWCLSYSQVPVTLVKISRCLGSLARVIFGTASRSYGRLHQGGESLAILTIQFWFGFFGVQNDLEAISTFFIRNWSLCKWIFIKQFRLFAPPYRVLGHQLGSSIGAETLWRLLTSISVPTPRLHVA